MTPKRECTDSIKDIIDALEKCLSFVENMNFETFDSDEKTVFAVIRALEIIGEAVKQVPQETRQQYPAIPWREMAGMRDKLLHHYFGISHTVVWQTITEDVPLLIPQFHQLLKNFTP